MCAADACMRSRVCVCVVCVHGCVRLCGASQCACINSARILHTIFQLTYSFSTACCICSAPRWSSGREPDIVGSSQWLAVQIFTFTSARQPHAVGSLQSQLGVNHTTTLRHMSALRACRVRCFGSITDERPCEEGRRTRP